MSYSRFSGIISLFFMFSVDVFSQHGAALKIDTVLSYPAERHLKNIKQLSFGGDNAEAYFSTDGRKLVFQSNNKVWGNNCDQIYFMNWSKSNLRVAPPKMVSTGKGRTTCAYFMPGNRTILYASTHLAGDSCPPVPERRTDGKYVWPVYDSYDIFVSDLTGRIVHQLTNTRGYDAEATVSPKGDKIVFTSMRSGDLELFVMDVDGKNVKQITNTTGYDGGAFFSPDGKKIVFRASRPKTDEEILEYKLLLAQGLVQPTQMEIFTCNADGSELKQITHLGKANWAPFFHPSGKKIIFSSNHKSQGGMPFNLYLMDLDGTNLEQITYDSFFDSFPMFSPDGKKLVFSSNRNNGGTRDTNLFIADWVE
jgi:Tol biopolymer transport system component